VANTQMKVVDCDGHVLEYVDEIVRYMDPTIRHIARRDESPLGSHPFMSLDGVHNMPKNPEQPERVGINGGRVGNAEDWLAFLDYSGIEQTVLFPTEGLSIGNNRHKEYTVRLCRAYNDWIADRFRRADRRFHPIAIIPVQFPREAVTELRRATKELDLAGAMIPTTGLPLHVAHEYYQPIYEEAATLDVPLVFHGGCNRGIGMDTFDDLRPARFLHHPVPLMIAFIGLAYGGVFDRFPGLKLAFFEGGAGWVTFLLDRARREQEFFTGPKLEDYLTSGRILVGCEGIDMTLPYLSGIIGVDCFSYASDYPHEADAKAIMHELEETIESPELNMEQKAAILGGNARRFFNL
jgi:predicted TIM-barrel fold metal-dependent hydrolase